MIYFDNAATTYPKPETVYRAVEECMRTYCGNPGRSGHKLSLHSGRTVLEAREAVAELFNVQNLDRIIFTLNATDSFNIALRGFLESGDHVIMSSMEHNSVARTIKHLESQGVENTIVECNELGEISIDAVREAIKPSTKLIVMIHASNVTGTLMPIKAIGELAREKSIRFMVDAAQTAGVYDIDVNALNIDFLVFTGHKSMYGIQGVGGLYINDDIHIKTIRVGGTGSSSESLLQPQIYPDWLESGTPNTPGIAGLREGIRFIQHEGVSKIRDYEEELCQYFLDKLKNIEKIKVYGPRNAKKQAPVISLNIGKTGSSDISYILDSRYDIATRSGLHCSPLAHKTIGTLDQGTVRFSLGYFNTEKQINKAIDALKSVVQEVKID